MERNSKGMIKYKSNQHNVSEDPIKLKIKVLKKKMYPCCKMEAKIKPLLIMSGSYCPYCGVKDYGIE